MTSRRKFIRIAPVVGLSLFASRSAFAQAPMVDAKDPQAAALGYVADATKADTKKFPKYAAGQTCGTCQLYTGSATAGPCSLFPGKQVAGKGWCSAWVKKA